MFFAKDTTAILQQLRLLMLMVDIVQNPLTAYIVPSGDAHHSLRMAACDQRRAFVTGFDGSSGVAVVTSNEALLWTDARYFIQAEEQMDENWTLMKDGIDIPMEEWLTSLEPGSYIGLDPKYYGKVEWDALKTVLENHNITLTHADYTNLVDEVWDDQPDCPKDAVKELSIEFSGKSVHAKIQEIYKEMDQERVETLIVTELDEIAWLLNLRGTDLPLAPVFNAYAILTRSAEQLEVFIDSIKISAEIKENLASQLDGKVTWYSYDDIYGRVQHYVNSELGKIWISKYCNAYLGSLIPEDIRIRVMKLTPISLLKAVKNDVEVTGMKRAHLRDSSSIVAFLAWLELFIQYEGIISEIDAADRLTSLKSTQTNYVNQSFPTISATGPNAAIVHYFPTIETNTNLSSNEMYLLDSGSHYLDGTTDITRSIHFGTPSDFQMECYTRVLKGHIAVATAKFPYKTKGHILDAFAREFLWQVGLDYGHGTGHGIGAYLNVGEGPHSASIKYNVDDPGLRENMFMSNEPGYYKVGQFGIRLENIVRVINSEKYAEFLELDTISYVPFQRKLIKTCLLTEAEIDWINDYHAKCLQFVGEYIMNPANRYNNVAIVMTWLEEQTRPIVMSCTDCKLAQE